jgi:hypothetical protein
MNFTPRPPRMPELSLLKSSSALYKSSLKLISSVYPLFKLATFLVPVFSLLKVGFTIFQYLVYGTSGRSVNIFRPVDLSLKFIKNRVLLSLENRNDRIHCLTEVLGYSIIIVVNNISRNRGEKEDFLSSLKASTTTVLKQRPFLLHIKQTKNKKHLKLLTVWHKDILGRIDRRIERLLETLRCVRHYQHWASKIHTSNL